MEIIRGLGPKKNYKIKTILGLMSLMFYLIVLQRVDFLALYAVIFMFKMLQQMLPQVNVLFSAEGTGFLGDSTDMEQGL